MLKKLAISAFAVLATLTTTAQASTFYDPFGPQQNVAISTVLSGGWTQCYSGTMSQSIGYNAEAVLSNCSGQYLMMAGRQTGSDNLLLLAETTFADATFNTGSGSQNTHNSNGSDWYFANDWSWGFTLAGAGVSLNQCDTNAGSDSMCLHTLNGVGGYRIGNIMGLNSSTAYEKLFFVSNGAITDVPEPATVALVGLGLLGFAVSRRRSAKNGNA